MWFRFAGTSPLPYTSRSPCLHRSNRVRYRIVLDILCVRRAVSQSYVDRLTQSHVGRVVHVGGQAARRLCNQDMAVQTLQVIRLPVGVALPRPRHLCQPSKPCQLYRVNCVRLFGRVVADRPFLVSCMKVAIGSHLCRVQPRTCCSMHKFSQSFDCSAKPQKSGRKFGFVWPGPI